MTSKPDRGWCIVGRWGDVLGWTFAWTRRGAICSFMEMYPGDEPVMKRWRRERDHGCRCVRAEVREIGGEE